MQYDMMILISCNFLILVESRLLNATKTIFNFLLICIAQRGHINNICERHSQFSYCLKITLNIINFRYNQLPLKYFVRIGYIYSIVVREREMRITYLFLPLCGKTK